MGLLDRLLGRKPDDRAELRAVWARVVAIGRSPAWYHRGGTVADTIAGRFDAITAVLCMVLLRMEDEPALIAPSVRLTEIFVEDMDGQMRQSGVGDLVVGKHMGKLMSVLGGRLGAYREALADQEAAVLQDAVRRNVNLLDDGDPAQVALMLRALSDDLRRRSAAQVLAGDFGAALITGKDGAWTPNSPA